MTEITSLDEIDTRDMIAHYHQCLNNLERHTWLLDIAQAALDSAKKHGTALEHAERTVRELTEMIDLDHKIRDVIAHEIKKRGGQVPAWKAVGKPNCSNCAYSVLATRKRSFAIYGLCYRCLNPNSDFYSPFPWTYGQPAVLCSQWKEKGDDYKDW